ncbi:hypothetical protein KM043_012983 [Ampulex compressa]|nr:hypothetical protein KM043_012983 [Ampulex compressa]
MPEIPAMPSLQPSAASRPPLPAARRHGMGSIPNAHRRVLLPKLSATDRPENMGPAKRDLRRPRARVRHLSSRPLEGAGGPERARENGKGRVPWAPARRLPSAGGVDGEARW